MTDYMVEGFIKKRAELAGEIERTHEHLRSLAKSLESLDATLRLVAPDIAVETIKIQGVSTTGGLEQARPDDEDGAVYSPDGTSAHDDARDR